MTDFEKMVTALLNGESVDLEPNCRCEEYLKACIDGTGTDSLPTPRSRMDILLWQLVEKMAGGGGGDTSYTYTWDGNTEGLDSITINEQLYYRVSTTIPPIEIYAVTGAKYSMTFDINSPERQAVDSGFPELVEGGNGIYCIKTSEHVADLRSYTIAIFVPPGNPHYASGVYLLPPVTLITPMFEVNTAFTWDGNTEGLESMDLGSGLVAYKVSDEVPPASCYVAGGVGTIGDGTTDSSVAFKFAQVMLSYGIAMLSHDGSNITV